MSVVSRRVAACLVPMALLVAAPLSAAPLERKTAAQQLQFGVEMARRNLWNEAFFRFQQASKLDPSNPRILNNLAVASEARGRFEEALKYYQDALRIASTDAEIKRNYARFVEFYQSFKTKPEGEAGETPPGAPDAAGTESQGGDG